MGKTPDIQNLLQIFNGLLNFSRPTTARFEFSTLQTFRKTMKARSHDGICIIVFFVLLYCNQRDQLRINYTLLQNNVSVNSKPDHPSPGRSPGIRTF